jgi:hypothetical protein
MSKLSVSITMGKASAKGGANVEHNNREFISNNVDGFRLHENITYVRKDVREMYDELFAESLAEYNAKQTRADRKINDYFEHIDGGSREESFYEIIIQFGDMDSAGVGTANGELVKTFLDDYVRGFMKRNPNLVIFNAVTHLDEQTPHCHINFIPIYNQPKKYGLSRGVSMRSALEELGFSNGSKKHNSLVAWHDSELKVMEDILKSHGMEREVIGATHKHKSVPEYKESQDWRKLPKRKKRSPDEITAENVRDLEIKNSLLEVENEKLLLEKHSPWKCFFYQDSEKQSFVQAKLDELGIPYRDSENGFESQEIFAEKIRQIEKQYKASPKSHRAKLCDVVDKLLMQSKSYDEFIERLEDSDYTVKCGKYIAVKPKFGTGFIRLKSLGADYSEQALKNRLTKKQHFEDNVNRQITNSQNGDSLEAMTYKTIRHYTMVFAAGVLPVHRIHKKKFFSWENCETLNRLTELNKRINSGTTLASLRNEFGELEKSVTDKVDKIALLKSELDFFRDLHNRGERCFGRGSLDERNLAVLAENEVTAENYHRILKVIAANESEIAEIESALPDERAKLKSASDTLALAEKVAEATWVQSLIDEEKRRTQSEFIPNGAMSAKTGLFGFSGGRKK